MARPGKSALRKKSQLAPKALWRRFTSGKMIYSKVDENGKSSE